MEALQGDYSQMFSSEPVSLGSDADMGRNWLGQLGGNQSFTEREDWLRSEQQANNAFVRDMIKLSEQNRFSADEAQKSRDWSEYMSNTAYQRAISDMKSSGLNPVLAFQQGGASTPSSSTASSGSGGSIRGSKYGSVGSGADVISSIVKVIAGVVAGAYGVAAAGTTRSSVNQTHSMSVNQNYNYKR